MKEAPEDYFLSSFTLLVTSGVVVVGRFLFFLLQLLNQ